MINNTENLSAKNILRLSKQQEKEEKKQAKEEAKKQAKQAKEEAKKQAKEAKEEAKKQAKQAKEEAKKQAKQAKEEAKKQAKEAKEAIKLARQREADAVRQARQREMYEHRNKSWEYLRNAGEEAALIRPNGKFTTGELQEAYKKLYPNTNPYTLVQYCDCYDIDAAIRGKMYESSPSSQQHWFQYGNLKERRQVAPWLFANKNLANVNNDFNWKQNTSVIATERRQRKGFWQLIPDSLGTSDLPEEYGKITSAEILYEASQNRKKGVRGRPPICVCID